MDSYLLPAALVFLLAGVIKGTFGLGLPAIAVGMLALFLPPRLAMSLVVPTLVLTNAWQVYRSGDTLGAIRRYWRLLAGCMLVIGPAAWFSRDLPSPVLVGLVGLIIMLFSLTHLLWRPRALPDHWDTPAQLGVGAITGVLGGLTTIWSPTIVGYLLAKQVDRDEFIRASGLAFFLASLPLAAVYWFGGLASPRLLVQSIGLMGPILAGFALGEMLRRRMDPERFRRYLLALFLLLGLDLLRRAAATGALGV